MVRLIVFFVVLISVVGFSLTQSEVSVLKYQLQMPSLIGNTIGMRFIGTLREGAFGLVWKWESKLGMFTGQVLGFNSVFAKWMETGVFEWSGVYFDIFLLLRF